MFQELSSRRELHRPRREPRGGTDSRRMAPHQRPQAFHASIPLVFADKRPVDLKTVYRFDDLEFVVLANFPSRLVSVVTEAVLSNISTLPGAEPPNELLKLETLHAGAQAAIRNF